MNGATVSVISVSSFFLWLSTLYRDCKHVLYLYLLSYYRMQLENRKLPRRHFKFK